MAFQPGDRVLVLRGTPFESIGVVAAVRDGRMTVVLADGSEGYGSATDPTVTLLGPEPDASMPQWRALHSTSADSSREAS